MQTPLFSNNGNFNNLNLNLSPVYSQAMPSFSSIIAIGEPIIDISSQIDEETLQKYGLKLGQTILANEENYPFFNKLENSAEVYYTPGGSVLNILRVASKFLNQESNNKYKLTMLGSVGSDKFKLNILNTLNSSGIKPILQIIPNIETSRCAVGICKKDRCLVTDIRASKYLSEDFLVQNAQEILNHDALIIEGYFLKDKYELCKKLCEEFNRLNKLVILTLCNTFMIEFHNEKIIELSNRADIIFGNFRTIQLLVGERGNNIQETIEKAHKKFTPKERLLVITAGCQGAFCSKFNYQKMQLEFISQYFPSYIKRSQIVDLNGAGDAFFGGFLSQQMKGKILKVCFKAGNDAANIVLRNVGCSFSKNAKINFNY